MKGNKKSPPGEEVGFLRPHVCRNQLPSPRALLGRSSLLLSAFPVFSAFPLLSWMHTVCLRSTEPATWPGAKEEPDETGYVQQGTGVKAQQLTLVKLTHRKTVQG